MTLTHYIGGKLTGNTADFDLPLSTNYPNLSTFINFETFTEFILVDGVWQQIGVIPLVLGGWKELARTKLDSPNSNISIPDDFPTSTLADKRYYMVLTDIAGESANADVGVRFNGLATSIYARRFSTNGGTDIATGNLANAMWHPTDVASTLPIFGVHYIANVSDKEKLFQGHTVRANVTGAGAAPARAEVIGKQSLTTDPIQQVEIITGTAATFNTNSEVVVLGWDPADDNVGGFWEELGTINGDGTTQLDIGILPKKYLWIQGFCEDTQSLQLTFNDDGGPNYSRRFSINGGADVTTGINQTSIGLNASTTTIFFNMFIINNQNQEKLVIHQDVERLTAGAANPPQRFEVQAKWTNNVSFITKLNFLKATNFSTGSKFKVWGHD